MIELIPQQSMSMFLLEGKAYYCIGAPIEVFAWYETPELNGVWKRKSNISDRLDSLRFNFASLQDASEYLKTCAKKPFYKYGLIKDFSGNGALYFDDIEALRYFKYHTEEVRHFSKQLNIKRME